MKTIHPALVGREKAKVLRLTLSKEAFEITGTEEKPYELRNQGTWIEERILNKDGGFKEFDYVLLIQGYGNTLPYKLFKFIEIRRTKHSIHWSFSNGLTFYQMTGDYIIQLGELIKQG